MKPYRLFILLLACVSFLPAFAQTKPGDEICGKYSVTSPNSNNTAKIEVYRAKDGTYQAKFIWTSANNPDGSTLRDVNNEDPAKRNRPIIGMVTIWGLKYVDGEYVDGSIYDPVSGKVYGIKGKKAKNGKDMDVRYFWKRPALGRDVVWKRI